MCHNIKWGIRCHPGGEQNPALFFKKPFCPVYYYRFPSWGGQHEGGCLKIGSIFFPITVRQWASSLSRLREFNWNCQKNSIMSKRSNRRCSRSDIQKIKRQKIGYQSHDFVEAIEKGQPGVTLIYYERELRKIRPAMLRSVRAES